MHLLAVGTRIPAWVNAGFQEYARRLPGPYRLELTEIASARWTKAADFERLKREEGERILTAVPRQSFIVALDVKGRMRSSEALARDLAAWLATGKSVAFLIGGAEGLADACLDAAADQWSLSPLILPHALVRVVVAEQLYRAYSTLTGQPYHRGSH
ncbi:MAG TPA: 23S rRNA (pseudouridine(1915)-N(3))-methyltransferase RlmH [Acidiferrobacter sp.]|nr:23S rRNA (pseudouridine(1915)-N(3))-methyltransferase RlmH [Acidiferrobacter sp.]